jgi:hypothetical protein
MNYCFNRTTGTHNYILIGAIDKSISISNWNALPHQFFFPVLSSSSTHGQDGERDTFRRISFCSARFLRSTSNVWRPSPSADLRAKIQNSNRAILLIGVAYRLGHQGLRIFFCFLGPSLIKIHQTRTGVCPLQVIAKLYEPPCLRDRKVLQDVLEEPKNSVWRFWKKNEIILWTK